MRLGLGHRLDGQALPGFSGGADARGCKIVGVPTSEATRAQAEKLGIPLTTLDQTPELDLTIDGADEIGPDLTLIKGGGGALLRKRSLRPASARMIVIADESKWVTTLGRFPLPVEVVSFGLAATRAKIEAATASLGAAGPAQLRRDKDGKTFCTDSGNWILDVALQRISDPRALAERLSVIPGVVEHGLFVGLAQAAILAGPGASVSSSDSRR
jgi:ribose 5-phosphate isomerase A